MLIRDANGDFRFFDDAGYLHHNPDVAAMVSSGEVSSPVTHFLERGQFEGRAGVALLADLFDEDLYLSENPDVLAAIRLGNFNSGLQHYVRHGHAEGRSGAPEIENPPDLLFPGPLPPPYLRKRVHGVVQRSSFERVGKAVSETLASIAATYLPKTGTMPKVLDFGCGCGRVLAYLNRCAEFELVGSDVDAEAIQWCKSNLVSIADFLVNEAMPPLDAPDNTFNLIYSISVMTHLPEDMQTAWLKELSRVAQPGALLILTTRGIHDVPLTWMQRRYYDWRGFLYCGGVLTPGLPDFYRNAFHSERYILRYWTKFFEVLEFRGRGLNGDQDLVICRKPVT